MHQTDEVAVRLVESTKNLEEVALAAAELLERSGKSPLFEMLVGQIRKTVDASDTARRHFRFGHDCIAARCDSDSHK